MRGVVHVDRANDKQVLRKTQSVFLDIFYNLKVFARIEILMIVGDIIANFKWSSYITLQLYILERFLCNELCRNYFIFPSLFVLNPLSRFKHTQILCEVLLHRRKVHLIQADEERSIRMQYGFKHKADKVG